MDFSEIEADIPADYSQPVQFSTCQFITDKDGIILECDPDIAEKINVPTGQLKNHSLRDILVTLNPNWQDALPAKLNDSFETLFLPWDIPENPVTLGIKLTRIPHNDFIFITMSPDLGEQDLLDTPNITDFNPHNEVIAKMFLRLQLSESRLNNYMQNFPGIFFCQRPDLSFTYIGPKFEELVSSDIKPLYKNGGTFLTTIYEKDRTFFLQEIEKNSSRAQTFSFSYRLNNSENGSIVYFMDVRTPLYSPAGLLLGYEGVWLDISRQSIAESRLTSSAWKENLATITSGLVHDFSNIMTGIHSLSELYHDSLDEDSSMYAGLGQIKKSSMEAQKLVRRIIDLNRENAGQRDYHNLETLIKDQIDLIKIILPRHIKLNVNLTDEEVPVYIDDIAFRQMLLNLAVNARDAFEGKPSGEIFIELKKLEKGDSALENTVSGAYTVDKDTIQMIFRDTGCGIPEGYLRRIFDAYFSTKEAMKGSGFGLYNAKLFIENNKGRISVASVEGIGTAFHILLPLADFTEMEAEHAEEAENNANTRRTSFAVYASKDPSTFGIVTGMRQREWEVISFDSIENVHTYLKDTEYPPHMLLAIDVAKDPNIQSLLEAMQTDYPGIKTGLYTIGSNPDETPVDIKNMVDLLISDTDPTPDNLRAIQALVS